MSNSMVEMIDNRIHNIFSVPEAYALSPFDLEGFRDHLLFTILKDSYDIVVPKQSVRASRGSDADDLRMRDSRMKAYAQYYRDLQYKRIKENTGIEVPELLSKDVSSMKGKLSGYQLSEMQYFELNTMAEQPLLKAIINKRICDVKKISNATFKEYYSKYDELVESLVAKLDGSDDDVLFAAVALFTLEWKYQVELFYACAVQAENLGIDEVPVERIGALCAELNMVIPPDFTTRLHTESRFVLHRMDLVPSVYSASKEEWAEIEDKLYQYFTAEYYIKNEIVRKWTLSEFFARYSTKAQWADFIRQHYDLRKIYVPREWTNKRIRYIRKIYQAIVRDIEPPKL